MESGQDWTTEENYRDRHLQYRAGAKLYLEQIDLLLQRGGKEDLYVFVGLYQKEQFIKTFASSLDELAYAAILANITGKELYQQEKRIFATEFHSVKDFILCWRKMKFLLWELEFEYDEDVVGRFYQYMKQGMYSSVVWEFLITTCAVKPKRTCKDLMALCVKEGDTEKAFFLQQLIQDNKYE